MAQHHISAGLRIYRAQFHAESYPLRRIACMNEPLMPIEVELNVARHSIGTRTPEHIAGRNICPCIAAEYLLAGIVLH